MRSKVDVLAHLLSCMGALHDQNWLLHGRLKVQNIRERAYFLYKTLFDRKLLLISINYYVPSWCKQIVYHINLLSFMKTPNDTVWKKIKEFDARIACKIATVNVFESDAASTAVAI